MPKRRRHLKTANGGVSRRPAARGTAVGGWFARIPRRWLYAAAAAAAAALLLGNQGFRTVVKNTLLLRRIHRELALEKEDARQLERSIKAVSSDDRALERAVRKELGYLKPGEVEYRFPPPSAKNK
ncbi:MAG: septum formation initiator family protein [Elusimicrobiota bacterium]